MIQGDCLYDERRFAQVELSEETRATIKQTPQGEKLIQLNRRLLEEAYPREIARSRAFAPWIFQIARNTAYDYIRRRNRQPEFLLNDDEEMDDYVRQISDEGPSLEEQVIGSLELEFLVQARREVLVPCKELFKIEIAVKYNMKRLIYIIVTDSLQGQF